MLVDEIWDFKSINMGRELEISGEFIYESAKKTMSITGLISYCIPEQLA